MAKKLDCRLKINKTKKTCINKKKSTKRTPAKKSIKKKSVKKSTKRTPAKKSKKLPKNYLKIRNPETGKEAHIKAKKFILLPNPSTGKLEKQYRLTGSDLMRGMRITK